jgi:hypothetical protein
MVTAKRQRDVRCLCECLERVVRTCDKGSIGARRSCLREACRPGLGSLLWEELVLDCVLRSRPGDGRLDDEAVSGLTTGMVSSSSAQSRFGRMRMRQPLHCLEGRGTLPTWTSHEKQVWEISQDWKLKASFFRLFSATTGRIDNHNNDILTSAVAYTRGRAGPSGGSFKLKAGEGIGGLDGRAHGQRHVGVEVLRVGEGEGGQRHGERDTEEGVCGISGRVDSCDMPRYISRSSSTCTTTMAASEVRRDAAKCGSDASLE